MLITGQEPSSFYESLPDSISLLVKIYPILKGPSLSYGAEAEIIQGDAVTPLHNRAVSCHGEAGKPEEGLNPFQVQGLFDPWGGLIAFPRPVSYVLDGLIACPESPEEAGMRAGVSLACSDQIDKTHVDPFLCDNVVSPVKGGEGLR